jgi:hypothetical protein
MRALRAAVVVPSLFALTFDVIGDPQMALFAVFGSFATLVMASFGGSRRDKIVAHLGLAVIGSVAAVEVGPPGREMSASLAVPALDGSGWQHSLAGAGPAARSSLRTVWVRDHLQHLGSHTHAITAPATRLAQQRRLPWWR